MAAKKKSPELSSGLLAVKGAAAPASAGVELRAPAEVTRAETDGNVDPLNFRVSSAFKRDFRVYAAEHGLKLNELLRLCFYAYRDRED